MTANPVLEIRNAGKVYGVGETLVTALHAATLTVGAGELVAVRGASGSGKSTLLHLAGGLDAPSSGDVLVEGRSLGGLSRKDLARLRRRSIGYVFQDLNLVPSLSAAENIALPRELDGTSATEARTEALAALEEIGLREVADRFPDEMSGGQQQRVAIARALIGPRRLVLADEPTGALDWETGRLVLEVIALVNRQLHTTTAVITHNAPIARMADRVVRLADGRIAETSTNPTPAPVAEIRW